MLRAVSCGLTGVICVRRRIAAVFGICVLVACSSSESSQPVDVDTSRDLDVGSETCRQTLECALYCDGDACASDCLVEAPAADVALVSAVMDCLSDCPDGPERGQCIADTCFAPYHACYSRGESGTASCAQTWTCFGDCGDEPACLDACLANTSLNGLQQFVAVEVCSDTYVTTQCAQPDCDALALSTVCESAFLSCLDSDLPAVTNEMTAACEQSATCNWSTEPREVESCVLVVRRALAGCPSADKEMLRAAQSCLAQAACTEVGWRGCPGWGTSGICQEIIGVPVDGRWP